jgi:Invasion associated locus B (IalB) protein
MLTILAVTLVSADDFVANSCRLIQDHATADGHTVSLVEMLSSPKSQGAVAGVSVPKGVYLAPGIELKADGGQGFKLLYETCSENGGHAGYKVTGDIGAALPETFLCLLHQPLVVRREFKEHLTWRCAFCNVYGGFAHRLGKARPQFNDAVWCRR